MVWSPFIPAARVSLGLYPLQVCAWRYLCCTEPEGAPSTLEERDLTNPLLQGREDSEKADRYLFLEVNIIYIQLYFLKSTDENKFL